MNLPKYKCHKVVQAAKVLNIIGLDDGGASIMISLGNNAATDVVVLPDWMARCKGSPDDWGYYVVYDDNYTSWSPTKAFEEGYTRIET